VFAQVWFILSGRNTEPTTGDKKRFALRFRDTKVNDHGMLNNNQSKVRQWGIYEPASHKAFFEDECASRFKPKVRISRSAHRERHHANSNLFQGERRLYNVGAGCFTSWLLVGVSVSGAKCASQVASMASPHNKQRARNTWYHFGENAARRPDIDRLIVVMRMQQNFRGLVRRCCGRHWHLPLLCKKQLCCGRVVAASRPRKQNNARFRLPRRTLFVVFGPRDRIVMKTRSVSVVTAIAGWRGRRQINTPSEMNHGLQRFVLDGSFETTRQTR